MEFITLTDDREGVRGQPTSGFEDKSLTETPPSIIEIALPNDQHSQNFSTLRFQQAPATTAKTCCHAEDGTLHKPSLTRHFQRHAPANRKMLPEKYSQQRSSEAGRKPGSLDTLNPTMLHTTPAIARINCTICPYIFYQQSLSSLKLNTTAINHKLTTRQRKPTNNTNPEHTIVASQIAHSHYCNCDQISSRTNQQNTRTTSPVTPTKTCKFLLEQTVHSES